MKRNIEDLFVATIVFDIGELIEPYEQYETFGRVDHHVIVTSKKRLVYKVIAEDGMEQYYDYETNQRIYEYARTSSYRTGASCYSNLYYGYTGGYIGMPIAGIREQIKNDFQSENSPKFSFFIPFTEYIHDKLGITIKSISPKIANALLKMLSIKTKSIVLSEDKETASQQIDQFVYGSKEEEKEKIHLIK